MEEADGDGLGLLRRDGGDDAIDLGLLEVDVHRARGGRPLPYLERQLALDRRIGRREQQVIAGGTGPRLAGQPQDVAEALRDRQRGAGAAPFEQHVGGEGRAVHEAVDVATAEPGPLEGDLDTVANPVAGIARCRHHFGDVDGSLAVDQHDIGERAADVDPQSGAHRLLRISSRNAAVAAASTVWLSSSTTPYARRAPAADTRSSTTS